MQAYNSKRTNGPRTVAIDSGWLTCSNGIKDRWQLSRCLAPGERIPTKSRARTKGAALVASLTNEGVLA
jgi:hypothetical protein